MIQTATKPLAPETSTFAPGRIAGIVTKEGPADLQPAGYKYIRDKSRVKAG